MEGRYRSLALNRRRSAYCPSCKTWTRSRRRRRCAAINEGSIDALDKGYGKITGNGGDVAAAAVPAVEGFGATGSAAPSPVMPLVPVPPSPSGLILLTFESGRSSSSPSS